MGVGGSEHICFLEGQFFWEKYKVVMDITCKFKFMYKGMYGKWVGSQPCLPYSYTARMISKCRFHLFYAKHLPSITFHCSLINLNSWRRDYRTLCMILSSVPCSFVIPVLPALQSSTCPLIYYSFLNFILSTNGHI